MSTKEAERSTDAGAKRESLTLKWGTLKAWDVDENGPAFAALKRYHEVGPVAWGAAQQRDTPEQKQAILDLIDALDADTVYLDWEGESVSKERAKRYVMEYGRRAPTHESESEARP